MALAAAPALAQTGFEEGDTGSLPGTAQEVGPAGPLEAIDGSIAGFADRDVYKICLTGGGTFSASTVGRTGWDTQLFLLDSEGRAVYSNDDSVAPWSTLPAGHPLTPTAPGVYYLAISAYNSDPSGEGGALFQTSSVGVNGPRGALRPMTGWSGFAVSAGGHYKIDLTGTRSCIPPDETAPAIDIASPADGAEFELDEVVLADYSCDDGAGSGVASCTGDVADGAAIDTSSLGEKSFTVVAVDRKGNRREASVTYTVVDRVKPSVDLRAPPDGAEYARGERVEADYSCADAGGSGLASCEGDVADGAPIDTASLGSKSFTVTARDGSGNTTSVTHTYRVVDRVKPSVDLRTPPDGAVYERNTPVAADYSCADEDGGSGLASCEGDVADGAAIDTATLGSKSFTVTATDGAGNTESVTHSYTVVDGSGPAIDVRSPADGATYGLDQEVLADYSCADEEGGSGLATCSGDVADGARIDTSDFGEHSFTVTATDRAGNTSTRTVTYRVVFDFEGFYGLDDPPALNRANAGSTVKIAFSLDGYQGREVFAAGYPRSVAIDCGSGAVTGDDRRAQSPGRAKLRYKPKRDLYVYLWKTDKRWRGQCRQFVLKLDDGSFHRVNFRFPARGHGGRDRDD